MESVRNESVPMEEDLPFLEENSILLLKERVLRFPDAKFKCKICQYHLSDSYFVLKHIEKHRRSGVQHLDEFQLKTINFFPLSRNCPSNYSQALDLFLVRIYEEHRVKKLDNREKLAQSIIQDLVVGSGIPDINLQHNGSSLSGFALKNVSEIDLSLQIKELPLVKQTLYDIYNFFDSKKKIYKNLDIDFMRRCPKFSFTISDENIPCIIYLKNENSHKTGVMLKEYWNMDSRVSVLGIVVRYWAYSLRLTNNKDTVIPSHSIVILLLHYLIHEGVIPCIRDYWPQDAENDNDDTSRPFSEILKEKLGPWKSSNSMSVGELWVGFLKYYALDFDIKDNVVNISSSAVVTKAEKQWKYKRLSVEDPFCFKNLLNVVHNTTIFEYIQKCFQHSCLFFGIPQTREGPLFKFIVDEEENIAQKIDQLSLNEKVSESFMVTIVEARERVESLKPDEIVMEWNVGQLTNHLKMPVVCSVCANEGHAQDSCPDEILPMVETQPPLPQKNLIYLNKFFYASMDNLMVTSMELRERDIILKDIMGFIRKSGYPTAILNVYGSSENGFGFKNSDLDMCLTFDDHETNDFDSTKVIQDIAKIVQKMSGIVNVRPITSAKVPIIKFFHCHTALEGDISLYNCLASENTKLLKTYSDIDPRLKVLGYNLKRFIKSCDFGDASRGSLSSYTCVIMAIYYLQHCQPPIVPVLQELYDHNSVEAPTRLFEGYNVWFNSNMNDILDWKNKHPKNEMSSAELLIGFFDFFGRQFDSDNIVVSIRTHKMIRKLDKMWNTDCLAVEDPFEVNRNLGGRLSRRMHLFIKKCFIKGYERYATPIPRKFRFKDYDKYYFNASNLGVGKAPTDRGCHICGGIWHVVRECPRKMVTKRRKATSKKNHDERQGRDNLADDVQNGHKKEEVLPKELPQRTRSNAHFYNQPNSHAQGKNSPNMLLTEMGGKRYSRMKGTKRSVPLIISKTEYEKKSRAREDETQALSNTEITPKKKKRGKIKGEKRKKRRMKSMSMFLNSDSELQSLVFYYQHGPKLN